ncbi:MAG TPA: CRISPR system precrRNA processing endoribonuclease RAMP protein Cas6 [Anaerolineae bacterium]|nr:CRISPR system precrRNA processing endoribonuclease RAMP protein Cas6 [Anaerolineae bacterium]
MWPFIKPIKLIRYLLVWRVNSPLVRLPRWLSTELSLGLGTMIANRLPTRQARPWRKALAARDEYGGISLIGRKKPWTLPEMPWPIETVLFVYPGKQTYGQGELILWELKLMGESADHGLFLEVILPALEEAGSVSDPQWQRKHGLWGRFDIHAVYVARGRRWEPVVSDGRLDLNYRATPVQWAEGLTFDLRSECIFDRLTWLTPFDLANDDASARGGQYPSTHSGQRGKKKIAPHQVPTLQSILESLIARMSQLLPGKHHTPDDVWDALSSEEQSSFRAVMEQASLVPVRHIHLEPAPKHWPGRWIGTQTFASIPHPIIPYLDLASILHIGKQTHFGCGTFVVS